MPAHRAAELRTFLLREWRKRIPCGWVRVLDDLQPHTTALEALVELRVRSEQAILLALGRGEMDRDRAIDLYVFETGAFSASAVGGQKHRLVLAPGMRQLAKDLREGQLREEAAAGAAGGPGAQGAAVTAPGVEWIGPGDIPSTSGAEAGGHVPKALQGPPPVPRRARLPRGYRRRTTTRDGALPLGPDTGYAAVPPPEGPAARAAVVEAPDN